MTRGRALMFRTALALIATLAVPTLAAERGPLGSPPITRFTPDIPFYPQHFAIAQDAQGLVYFGGGDGTLVYDGARWQLLRLPNRDLVRSLAVDGENRVYVGGYGVLGWYERDTTGAIVFHDLTAEATTLAGSADIADIWELFVFPEGVLFRALNHVFLYDPKSGAMRHWAHAGRFGTAYRDNDGVVLQFRGEGFKRLAGDDWVLVPGGGAFTDLVYHALPLPDGSRLMRVRNSGWMTLRDGQTAPAVLPPALPAAGRVSEAEALPDGTLVIADEQGALFVWDPRAGSVQRIQVGDEFASDIALAHDGGLLVGGAGSFYRVEWPTAWTAVGTEVGLRGLVHGAAEFRGELVALTGAGAGALRRADDGQPFLARYEWADHEVWDLLQVADRIALVATSYALLEFDGTRTHKLSSDTLYPRVLQRSRFDPDLVLIGTEHGLALARRDARGWRITAERTDPAAPNVRNIVEIAPGELLLGTQRGGVIQATLEAGGNGIARFTAHPASPPLGLDRELNLMRTAQGAVIASTGAGLFRLDGERFVADDMAGLATLRGPDELLYLALAPDGGLWAWSRYALWRHAPDGAWVEQDISAIRRGVIENLSFDAAGEVVVATTTGLLFHRTVDAAAKRPAPRIVLRSALEVGAGEVERALPLDGSVARLAQGDFALRFRFALPDFRRPGSARFRGRLLPVEPEMSAWSTSTQYSYYRMRPGHYRLEVEARDAEGNITAIAPFEFDIAPPWYTSTLSLVLWALIALAALVWTARAVFARRTLLLAEETARLERMVGERTRELADANRKLDTIAHLDGLTGLPNRRRLDEYLTQVWALGTERERPLAVLAIDVDRFKDYNDKHGHLAGDTLLKRLAPLLSRNLRRTEDLAARYGGEEFLVVLPGADAEVARQVAEALREKVASSSIGATISVGVAAETPREGRTVTELVALADGALYRAKAAGRNRVEVDGA